MPKHLTTNDHYVQQDTLVYNVKDHGAVIDGTTDDASAINSLLASVPAGSTVFVPRGVCRIGSPLLVPPYVTLRGAHGGGEAQSTSSPRPSCIKPLASFTGSAAIKILDQQSGGYATLASEIKIESLTVDGSAVPGGTTVDGILASGQVQHLQVHDVQIRQVTGIGINTAYNFSAPPGPQAPFCLHFDRVSVLWAGSHGIALNNSTDSHFSDVYVLGCTGFGWYISGADNSTWMGCRAEWSGLDGFNLAGNNGVETFIGCSTDRNGQNGFSVPASADIGTIALSNCRMARDGKTSTVSGYSGLKVSNTTRKVLVDGAVITTGRDDDGVSGNLSPQYGISATGSACVVVTSGSIDGVSGAWQDGGGNTIFLRGPMVTGSGITSWMWPGAASTTASSGTATILQSSASGDTQPRCLVNANGKMTYGPGGVTAPDTTGWYRDSVGVLKSDTYVVLGGSGQSDGTFTTWQGTAKSLVAGTVGGGFAIKEGTNARMGVATLSGGTVIVANTSVTSATRIFLSRVSGASANFGTLTYTVNAGTSFTVSSTNASDTSVVNWLLMEPA